MIRSVKSYCSIILRDIEGDYNTLEKLQLMVSETSLQNLDKFIGIIVRGESNYLEDLMGSGASIMIFSMCIIQMKCSRVLE